MDFLKLNARLSATNAAKRDLWNMQIQMDSLSIVQRRARAQKAQLLTVVELAVQQVVTASTGQAPANIVGDASEDVTQPELHAQSRGG